MALLSINNLSVQYKNSPPTLQGFSLNLMPCDILALVGGNGTGKSTIIGVLAGLIPSYCGEIYFNNSPWDKAALRKSAFVFDHPKFPSFLNARQILNFFASEYGAESEEIDRILTLCGLSNNNKNFGRFSRGMRQSLALAGALLKQPKLLIIDEGFSAIDRETRERIFDYLKKRAHEALCSVLFTTHSEQDSRQLATRSLQLKSINV